MLENSLLLHSKSLHSLLIVLSLSSFCPVIACQCVFIRLPKTQDCHEMWCKQRRKRRDTSNAVSKESTDSVNRPSSSGKVNYDKNSLSPSNRTRSHPSSATAARSSSNGPTEVPPSHATSVPPQRQTGSTESSRTNLHSYPTTDTAVSSSFSSSSSFPSAHQVAPGAPHNLSDRMASGGNSFPGVQRPSSQQYYYSASSSTSLTPTKLPSAPPTPNVKPSLINVPLPSAPLTSNILDSLNMESDTSSSTLSLHPAHQSSNSTSGSDPSRQPTQELQKVTEKQVSLLQDLTKLYLLTQTVSKLAPRKPAQPRVQLGGREAGGAGRASYRVVEQSQVFDYKNRRNMLLQLEATHAREEQCAENYRHFPRKKT